jgi:hypothetical protein
MPSFDPLDLAIMEKALKDAKAAVQNNDPWREPQMPRKRCVIGFST